jgi:hypothetical protein
MECIGPRDKVIAFPRFDQGGPSNDVIVVLNFANRAYDRYTIGFPRRGCYGRSRTWHSSLRITVVEDRHRQRAGPVPLLRKPANTEKDADVHRCELVHRRPVRSKPKLIC